MRAARVLRFGTVDDVVVEVEGLPDTEPGSASQ